jgi:lipid II:glycine glycyltransferase (peptidoglycan interpeptide bridge formation enzyme)
MKFTILNEDEYSNFLDNHPLKTFLQTVEMAKLEESHGWKAHFVGIKENDKILCATMMISRKTKLGFNYFSAPRGYLIDFNDKNLLTLFTKEIKKYIKEHKGYVLNIEPKVFYKERDADGNLVPNGFDNTPIFNNLIDLGYKHGGFYTKLNLTKQVRWAFVLRLEGKTEDEIFNEMRPNTRNHLKKASKYNVETRELLYDELETFRGIVESSGQRKSFHSRSLKYYQDMYKTFHDKGWVKYIVAELDVKKYIDKLQAEIMSELDKKEQLEDKASTRGLKKEIDKNVVSLNKRLEEALQIKEKEHSDKIILAGAMFLTYGDEIAYLFSGSRSEYLSYGGQYCIQWDMIKYGIKNGFKAHDFYGISGDLSESDDRYGVYEFKKGFGGTVVEYIGDFDLIVNKPVYMLQEAIKNAKKMIKK